MMTIDEIRRENLNTLVREFGGVGQLAEIIGKSDAQVSQWKNASVDSKTKKPRGISDDVCRDIEASCNKPHGWMDNKHDAAAANSSVSPDKLIQLINGYGTLDDERREQLLDFMAAQISVIGDTSGETTQNKV